MFSSLVQITVVLSSLATIVSAHGFVRSVTLDGKVYKGGMPFTEGGSRNPKSGNPIWTIRNNGPAVPAAGKMANSRALACGREAIAASFTAPVTAGSQVTINWGDWPHNSGPVITYLGACNGDCSKADPTKINFFKIHEQGFVPGTTKWVQDTVLKAKKPFTFTLPKNIPSGNFMMRHEIIALHLAPKLDGAEFYPTCIQLNVKGGTGSVPSQTVKFPGGYKNTDAGILFNIFNGNNNLKKYKIPGPPIALTGSTGTGVKSVGNDTVDDTTGDDDNVIIGDDNNGGDNTDNGDETTTGGDDTTGDDETGDDETNGDDYSDEDGTTGDDNGSDDTEGDDSGCTGGDDEEEEDSGNTDEPVTSVSDVVATETESSAPSETSSSSTGGSKGGSKGGKHNGKGRGGRKHNHKHNHRSDEAVQAGSPRMVKRHRMHLAVDLAQQMAS
ncbi:hypothetical protein FRC02_004607 [Tulasnella sp. 418]|nr:hypothetical protein FRC02_004607 [Tulasnella sp. 418]